MKQDSKEDVIIFGLLIIPVIWLALLSAPYMNEGLFGIIANLSDALNKPFSIVLCKDTPKTIFIFLLMYVVGLCIYYSTRRNYRRNQEYGSARWGSPKQVNKKYASKNFKDDKLFTQNVRMMLDGRTTRRNLNTLVIGGSGAGKTRFYCMPNIMQCNTSFVCLDPKGELLNDLGELLEKQGYIIKVLDLIDMEKSHGYNPFQYIQDDNDVLKLISNLIRNTTPKGTQPVDPFWESSEKALLEAMMLYLYHEAPEDEQNFSMIMEMFSAAEVKEDDDDYESPLDELFHRLKIRNPNSLALKQYEVFKKAPGKTAMSILISMGVRLAPFNFESVDSLTKFDELELEKLGDRKTALFALIPDDDSSFNFIVGMLYTQLFQALYRRCSTLPNKTLPVPVHFVMDEFANVSLPDDFDKILATMRSRGIFVSIILQNLAQLKNLYKDSWESIVGNCDEFLYLGGNEQSTHKYVSELLGKETLDTNTYGKSSGVHGNYSTNYQQTGRELLTQDEARMLNNDYALLFIRGERPIYDLKIDILKHPNCKYTTNGEGKPFMHGNADHTYENWQDIELTDNEYELLSEEDMDEYFKQLAIKEKNNEKKK